MALPAAVLVGGIVGIGPARAFASGAADQRVAQVESSIHCLDPNNLICAPFTPGGKGLGTGSSVLSVTLNTDGGKTADATLTQNMHQTPGFPNGAIQTDLTGTWSVASSRLPNDPLFFYPMAYTGALYVITFGDNFVVEVPVVQGHYSMTFAPRVFVQTQIAP
jgi:hypothetical protein